MLSNIQKIAESGKTQLVIRVPVIPTFNDSEREIADIARFADGLPPQDRFALSILRFQEASVLLRDSTIRLQDAGHFIPAVTASHFGIFRLR